MISLTGTAVFIYLLYLFGSKHILINYTIKTKINKSMLEHNSKALTGVVIRPKNVSGLHTYISMCKTNSKHKIQLK